MRAQELVVILSNVKYNDNYLEKQSYFAKIISFTFYICNFKCN